MKKLVLLCATLSFIMLFSACVSGEIDELYSLPQTQEKYQQLQTLIDKELAAGAEYSAPTGGTSRQSVQLVDIDGDGTEEALAFLKNASSTPMICIYRITNGDYALVSTITGEGTYIGRVEYADLVGDGLSEIIVSWKMSSGLTTITAYSLYDWASALVLSVTGTDFRVADYEAPDSVTGIVSGLAVLNVEEVSGEVELYFTDETGELISYSSNLSSCITSVARFRVQSIEGNIPAIIVEGSFKEEDGGTLYLTDMFVFSGGRLNNITLDQRSGDSIAIRRVQIYSQDIDGDGNFEIPFLEQVYKQPSSNTDYYVIDWMRFSSDGSAALCASTYHEIDDGWYYIIPEEWRENFTLRWETVRLGERKVVLSTVDGITNEVTDKLTIYTLSDENRNVRSRLPGRFILTYNDTTVYAAELELPPGVEATQEQKDDAIKRFNIITAEWTTGAI